VRKKRKKRKKKVVELGLSVFVCLFRESWVKERGSSYMVERVERSPSSTGIVPDKKLDPTQLQVRRRRVGLLVIEKERRRGRDVHTSQLALGQVQLR